MMEDEQSTPSRPDVADLLADRFPGHTMQRRRTADGKYSYLYVSSGVQSSFGIDPEDLMKAEDVDHAWVHADDRQRFVDELEHSAHHLTPLDTEVRVEAPGGGYRWVRSLGQPRRQPDGSTIWDGVALDVNDRREALSALERAMAEARRSEVTEGRFAYIAAQDLAAPLADLRDVIARIAQQAPPGGSHQSKLAEELTARFDNFEKALFATKALVNATGAEAQPKAQSIQDPRLTKRQADILTQLKSGASNASIAEVLEISEGTVKQHVSAIFKKLGVRNRTEAARQ